MDLKEAQSLFQSLFYWNTSNELKYYKREYKKVSFQSLFYWNTSNERISYGLFSLLRRGFNPCSTGIPLMSWRELREGDFPQAAFQSLFYWNTSNESTVPINRGAIGMRVSILVLLEYL